MRLGLGARNKIPARLFQIAQSERKQNNILQTNEINSIHKGLAPRQFAQEKIAIPFFLTSEMVRVL